jgi:hypothetical protein
MCAASSPVSEVGSDSGRFKGTPLATFSCFNKHSKTNSAFFYPGLKDDSICWSEAFGVAPVLLNVLRDIFGVHLAVARWRVSAVVVDNHAERKTELLSSLAHLSNVCSKRKHQKEYETRTRRTFARILNLLVANSVEIDVKMQTRKT